MKILKNLNGGGVVNLSIYSPSSFRAPAVSGALAVSKG